MERQTSQHSAGVEFTYSRYREFLDRILAVGYEIRRFADGVDPGAVILRHDVDLSVRDALKMALIEAERDISTTYCFLLTSPLYNPLEREQREQIHEIAALGHEVALHFSTHEYWDTAKEPGDDELGRRIEEERTVLDTIAPGTTETVSFHSPPEWVLNRDLADVQNAYAPAYFENVTYVADSSQRWRSSPPVVEEFGESAQVLVHPGLWSENDGTFDERVERAVTRSCRHANAKAQAEFLRDGADTDGAETDGREEGAADV